MPIGTTSSKMTLITVRDEKIVTKEEIQDSGQSASESASSSSDTYFIEIPKENVQEMKSQYFSLNDICDDDDILPPCKSPSIDLRSGNEDRQSPWDMNDQAYGDVERHNFATDLGRGRLCPIHGDMQTSTLMLMMKHPACEDCRSQYLGLVGELADIPQEPLTNIDPRGNEDWPFSREPDQKSNFGIILDHFNSRSVTVVDSHNSKPSG